MKNFSNRPRPPLPIPSKKSRIWHTRGQYDVIVLDEIVFCLSSGLAKLEDMVKIIEIRDPTVELILTGRGATAELIARADLVTEMKAVKHPHGNGTGARKGIEF